LRLVEGGTEVVLAMKLTRIAEDSETCHRGCSKDIPKASNAEYAKNCRGAREERGSWLEPAQTKVTFPVDYLFLTQTGLW